MPSGKGITVSGTSTSTSLYVNGKLIDDLNIQTLYFNGGKNKMNYVRTLVFPLEKTGQFKSRIKNLKLYQND